MSLSGTAGAIRTKIQQRFCMETRPDPCGLVIFGASGDLAERKLFPSLFRLFNARQLPGGFYAVGVGRTALDDTAFRTRVDRSVRSAVKNPDREVLDSFLGLFHYHVLNYDEPADFKALADRLASLNDVFKTRGNRAYYLSLPPSLYGKVVAELGRAGLAREKENNLGWARAIIEKPFGRDLAGALALSDDIRRTFTEDQIYRIDHYLGKETVQNILVLRFANIFLSRYGTGPMWIMSKSPPPKTSASVTGPDTTKNRGVCATCFRTICCSWSA